MMNSIDIESFGRTVAESVGQWLDRMADGLPDGRFRYCQRHSLTPTRNHAAQFTTCFAMKIAWSTGLWEKWNPERRKACITFVKSFQRSDGSFVDQAMLKRITIGNILGSLRRANLKMMLDLSAARERAIRAETRQSASTLLMVGSQPQYPLLCPWQEEDQVRDFIRGRNWTNPWGSGSHASHLIFALHVNAKHFGVVARAEQLIAAGFDELEKLRIPRNGTWSSEDVSSTIQINGAMKVLTAYKWAGKVPDYARELLDYALDQPFQYDGCGFLNRLFVVRECSTYVPGYRNQDVCDLAVRALQQCTGFLNPDGAFSFHVGCAMNRYYGAWTSLGGKQSDIHGTTMLTWAVALCFEMLGKGDSLGWRSFAP